MPTNHKATWSKRQREQDQKDRAAERIARRRDRKARAVQRAATGQVGPQIAEPDAVESEIDEAPAPAEASDAADPGAPARLPVDSVPARPRNRDAQGNRLYVGNLSFNTNSTAVRELFAKLGEVTDVHVVMDHVTGRPRGFAFVTMGTAAQAQQAIQALDGQLVDSQPLRVNQAEQREQQRGFDRRGAGRGRF